MLNLLTSLPSSAVCVHFLALLGFLGQLVQGAVVTDVFTVKTGTGGGSCDGLNIAGWFGDAQTLIASAVTGVAATDTDSQKYLTTFFSLKPGDPVTDVSGPIDQVSDVLNGNSVPPGGKPWLFCSSDWLQEQAWDDVAFDPATGQPRTDGQTVEDIFGHRHPNEVPFWSDDLRQYVQSDPGDYCSNGGNLAAVQDQTAPSTLTLCTANFLTTQGDTLANVAPVTALKVSVSTLQVHSLTLFHEMFHVTLGTAATPDWSYALNSIVRFGTAKASQNPESYTFYAFAYWLGQQSTQFTFANSKSAKR